MKTNRSFSRLLLVVTLPVALGAFCQASCAQAPAPPLPNVITVQGTGEVQNKPDCAQLTMGVQTQDLVADAAARENATRTDAVIKAVRAVGVAETDIQTSDYSINPQQQFEPNKAPVITGYQVSNTVRITVRRLADVGKVIDAAIKAGANVAGGISFELNNDNAAKARDEAMTRAVADAKRKASILARASGLADFSLFRITEGGVNRVTQYSTLANARFSAPDANPTPIQAGELTTNATVTVEYRFTNAPLLKP